MTNAIVLDSTPLSLLVHRGTIPLAERCRRWVRDELANGTRIYVPEIISYELSRELLRLKKARATAQLGIFLNAESDRLLPITSADLTFAARLWAESRQRGLPTADIHALDIDVILAAQVLNSGLDRATTVVATSNLRHLSQFVPAVRWDQIR